MATATFAIVSLVATAVGTGIQYVQQRRAANAQEAAAEYNARILENRAKQTQDTAAANAARLHEQKRRRLASIRAKAAGEGSTLTGSVMETYLDESAFLERDIQSQIYDAQSIARTQQQQAGMTRWEGHQRAAATRANANAGLLTGVGNLASSGYEYGQSFGTVSTRLY